MTYDSGDRLGKYEIHSLIGKGGMGEVYLARDRELERDVAIKVLPAEVATNPERLARFEREAKALAALDHPNIAALYGMERDAQSPFLVMQLASGEDLAAHIARGPIAIDQTISLFVQIAEGLEAAHAKGILHRDLKPANIKAELLGPDEQPRIKILDFGLAKAFAPGDSESGVDASREPAFQSESPTISLGATRHGQLLGTAAYMSPEQVRGQAVDGRADIWAFGCCLFEALTGQRPFTGEDAADTLAAVLRAEVDWQALPAETPAALRKVMARCLARSPHRRYQHVGDLRLELEELRDAGPGDLERMVSLPSAASAGRFGRGVLSAVALLALLAGAGLGGLAAWRMQGASDSDAEVRQVRRFIVEQSSPERQLRWPAISPDGSRILFGAGASTREMGLHQRYLNSVTSTLVPGAQPGFYPFFSPSGDEAGFIGTEGDSRFVLRTIDLATGSTRALTKLTSFQFPTWGSDDFIYYSRADVQRFGAPAEERGLWRIPGRGGVAENLTAADQGTAHMFPEVLPAKAGVLFTEMGPAPNIRHLSLETGAVVPLLENASQARFVAPGFLVFFRAERLWAVTFDPEAATVLGEPRPVLDGLAPYRFFNFSQFSVSPRGDLAVMTAAAGAGHRLVLVDRDGNARELSQPGDLLGSPRFSPDGRRLVFEVTVRQPGLQRELWLLDLERDVATRMNLVAETKMFPLFSPDGRWIAVCSDHEGAIQAYRVSVDREGVVELLNGAREGLCPVSWEADGRAILLQSVDPALGGLWRLDLEGGEVESVIDAEAGIRGAAISLDGQWLAYSSGESDRFEIYLRRLDGTGRRTQLSSGGAQFPDWLPNGELFYQADTRAGLTVVPIETDPELVIGEARSATPQRPLFDFRTSAFDVAADGRIVMVQEKAPRGAQLLYVENWVQELEQLLQP